MTEIQQYQNPAATPAPSTIQQTALELSGAMTIAQAICNSTFVPQHFRNKPEECAVAMLYGATIGFDPVTSVQQIYVISGKPALYARAMVAIVLGAGHDIWVEEEKPGSVTVAGRRKGSDKVQSVTWTTEMAQRAGYTKNSKYQSDPQSMLYARASGDLARRIAPDALLGMAYNVEEMEIAPRDLGDAVVEHTTAGSQKDRVRAALATPPAANTPPVQPPATAGITEPQLKKLHTSFSELGIIEREDRIRYASNIVGRALSSSTELTKEDASRVIEALTAELFARQQTPPVEVVEAELVETGPALNELWEQIVAVGGNLGMSLWDIESAYASQYNGTMPQDGDAAQYQAFLTYLQSLTQEANA